MTRCYHTCICGKVHRFKRENFDPRYFKCPHPIDDSKFVLCGKPVVHLFYINGAYHASCGEHWDGKLELYGGGEVELEDLE